MKKLLLVIPAAILLLHFSYLTDGPNSWTPTITTIGAVWQNCIVIHPTTPFTMYAASNSTGIWKSTNGGLNWTQSNGSMTNLVMQAIAISKSNPNVLYCGTGTTGFGAGLYKTTDAGVTWTFVNTGITDAPGTQEFSISPTDPNIVYVSIWDASTIVNAINGLYKTTNGGTSWAPCNTGMGANKNIICNIMNPLNPNTIYAGSSFIVNPNTGPTYVYKSYNAGASWASFSTGLPVGTTEINPVRVLSMSTIDTNTIIAGLFQNTTTGGAFFTSNGGTSWTKRSTGIASIAGVNIRSILIRPGSNTEFYAGIDNATSGGVYKTTNAGNSWTSFNGAAMLASYVVRSLTFRTTIDSTLFAGVGAPTGAGFGIYEYSYGPLGLPDPNEVPTSYNLFQNYPNPFNPVTKIVYQIPKASFVKLSVYDAEGKLVKVLFEGMQSQLTNTLEFNASDLSSGVYFYEINARQDGSSTGDFRDVKKMILVK